MKQAPFVVLIGAAMPSVLAEISFVTNPQEAQAAQAAAPTGSRSRRRSSTPIRKYQTSLDSASSRAQ